MKNKGCLLSAGFFGFVTLILIVWTMESYNKLVRLNEQTNKSWADVESQYQRRMDLIPNLVSFVKTRMSQETHIFEEIAQARKRYGDAQTLKNKVSAVSALDSALSRLLVIVERYPDLRAGEQYNRLMDEWAGTENRIAVHRMRYNEKVEMYNRHTKSLPTVFFVNMFNFDKEKPYYKAEKIAEKAPVFKEEKFE